MTECLGYPTRTAAVIALRQQGKTTREIATAIGITPSTVSALEISYGRSTRPSATSPAVGAIRMSRIEDHFSGEHLRLLRPYAAKREMSVGLLIKTIVRTVAEDGMVDAVLDDGDRP